MSEKGFIKDGAIAVRDGKIVYVGKSSAAADIRAETRIDARGNVAMPGLINCHTHAPMTLFRGLAEDQTLDTWLKETIWPLEAKLKPEDVYAGALLACLEMIKSGTTCFADMYFHEDMVARAVEKSGLRGALAEGIIEAGNEALGEKMLSDGVNFVRSFNGYADSRVTALFGPHAVYSCSPELLAKVRRKASELKAGIHVHLAESKKMAEQIEREQGSSEVEMLDKIGFLETDVIAAHCIELSKKDIQILSKHRVNVAYNPVANMKLGSGTPKIKDLVDYGVNVCLGTDGPASNNTLDMFETVKFAALLQKFTYSNPKILPAHEALKMATINGAKALRLEESVGSLEVGKKADVVLIDFSRPHLTPLHDVYASMVYSASGSDVDTVIVDGRILMENRQVKTLDEQAVMEKAEEAALDLLSR
ncbi:amidohydrolase [Candidatus Bathyarchaeota archaeon]|nr:amidohydrolase [Candidatus Bathyarchaeota archaeon]